jgi:hypothetical protein
MNVFGHRAFAEVVWSALAAVGATAPTATPAHRDGA